MIAALTIWSHLLGKAFLRMRDNLQSGALDPQVRKPYLDEIPKLLDGRQKTPQRLFCQVVCNFS